MEKKKNIPELRFPEFEGEWELEKLGSYFAERNELSNEQIPLYSLTIENGIIPKSERYERSFLVNEIEEAYKVMYPNDFALNPMNLRFGAIAKNKENIKVSVSKYYNIFYCNERANSDYFEYYLKSYNMIQYYNKMATGSLMEKKRVHYLDFIHFKKLIPNLSEQNKIATFLSAVYEKHSKLKKKKRLLEQYKKGVMQKIFSQEIRFRDENGKEFPKWEKRKISEIFQINAGGDIDKKNFSKEKDGKFIYPVFSNSENNKGLFGYSDVYKIDQQSVTVTGRGALGYAVARYEKYYPIVRLLILTPIIKSDVFFYENLINTTNFFVESTGVPQLTAPQISNYKISYPHFAEQNKIAKFLSVIDDKINLVSEQIEKTKLWKKGLLQKMFC